MRDKPATGRRCTPGRRCAGNSVGFPIDGGQPVRVSSPSPSTMNWFYALEGQSLGPVDDAELARLAAAGTVKDDTLVWREGFSGWQPYATVRPEATPPSPAAGAADVPPPGIADTAKVRCAGCGLAFAEEETIAINGARICGACKPAYLQRLAEGGVPAGSTSSPGTHGNLGPDEIAGRDYSVGATDRISEAWGFIFREPSVLLLGGALVFFVTLAMQAVPYLGPIVGLVMTGPMLGGLNLFFIRRLRGETVQLGDAFCGFGPRFGQLALAHVVPSLLSGLCYLPGIAIGAVAIVRMLQRGAGPKGDDIAILVVAGIALLAGMIVAMWLTVGWMYTILLVADKGYGLTAAMSLSRRVVRLHFWQNLWLVFLGGIVVSAGFMAACVGIFVTFPLVTAAIAIQYDRMFRDLAPAKA